MKPKQKKTNISITASLRFRPLANDSSQSLKIDPLQMKKIIKVLTPHHDQLETFEQIALDSIPDFQIGYNCTTFCYGQTGSGKTYTLFGPMNSFHMNCLGDANEDFQGFSIPNTWGIFPRVILTLLKNVSCISATAVEVYMDQCFDLMNENKQKISIAGFGRSSKVSGKGTYLECSSIKRDSNGKWIPPTTEVTKKLDSYELTGASVKTIRNIDDLVHFMMIVEATRIAKSHKLNERSSRSHCVLTLSIPSLHNGKYMLVDLAGSERIVKSGSIDCQAAEARNINTSLTTLGRCITALAKGQPFVPYRDSVLTMLLKQSLGGRCITSVIITATEDAAMHHETMSSIQFGQRCSCVSNEKRQESTTLNTKALIEKTRLELREVDEDIRKMTNEGLNGGINTTDFPKCTQKSLQDNLDRYNLHSKNVRDIKQQLKALNLGNKDENSSSKSRRELNHRLTYEESQVKNLKGIILRSMTTGIWTDPSPKYVQRVQCHNELRELLSSMDQDISNIEMLTIPTTFEVLLRGFTG